MIKKGKNIYKKSGSMKTTKDSAVVKTRDNVVADVMSTRSRTGQEA
jgi:hypothetical protein